ncbi:MAG: LptA/OstA family protein [Candidatus Aminicenantaceae bacterium]
MKKQRIRPALIFKVFIALFMLAAVSLIIQNFVNRSRLRPRVPHVETEIAEQKVETTEEIQHFQLRRGEIDYVAQAARHYIGEDGLYHLEGDVQLKFPGRADGEDVVLTAGEIVHDRENAFFRMLGGAVLAVKDIRIEAESFEYQTEEERLLTDRPVRFTSERISGSAKEAVYRATNQRLILRKEVRLSLTTASDPSRPVQIEGNELDYLHSQGSGAIRGDARIHAGESFADASLIRFDLFSNKENLRKVLMQGDVHLVTTGEDSSGSDPETEGQAVRPERRELRARKVVIRAWHNSQEIRSLEAEGKCYLRQDTAGGEFIETTADRLDIQFNRKGGMRTFHARGHVNMAEQREGESRTVRGGVLSIEGKKQILHVESSEESRARIKAGDYEIEADVLDIMLNSRNLEAAGKVNVIMTSPKEEAPAVGFFGGTDDIFVKAEEMRYSGENRRFLFKGDVKVWQGKETMLTQEMTIFREGGNMVCREGVETHITVNPKGEEYDLEIRADTLEYKPSTRRLTYSGDVIVKVEASELKADELNIRLSEEDNKIQTLLALGDVEVIRDLYRAEGQEAVFNLEKETIQLSGSPVLTHQQKGRVQGNKLTFYLADDRIIVENKGRERSETVIKQS